MRSPRRPLLALLPAASLALAACDQSTGAGCPGTTLARLALHGTLDASRTGCQAAPEGGWNVPATLPADAPEGTFPAELSWEESTQRLVYCAGGSSAAVLFGTRTGDHVRAEVTMAGAVLGQCSATCTPLMTLVVEGDLATGSAPATFAGTLTETFAGGAGDCGSCRLPCTSTYTLAGTGQ